MPPRVCPAAGVWGTLWLPGPDLTNPSQKALEVLLARGFGRALAVRRPAPGPAGLLIGRVRGLHRRLLAKCLAPLRPGVVLLASQRGGQGPVYQLRRVLFSSIALEHRRKSLRHRAGRCHGAAGPRRGQRPRHSSARCCARPCRRAVRCGQPGRAGPRAGWMAPAVWSTRGGGPPAAVPRAASEAVLAY